MRNLLLIAFLGAISTGVILSQIDDFLIASYPFSGNTQEAQGKTPPCTNQGAILTNDRFGNQNNAQNFDGATNQMECQLSSSTFIDNYTISAWIFHRSMTAWGAIVSNNVGINQAPILSMMDVNTSIGIVDVQHSGDGASVDLGPDHQNTWIFAAVIKNQSRVQAISIEFESGKQLSSLWTTISWTPKSSDRIYIGRSQSGEPTKLKFDGIIDDVRIYNQSLSIENIWYLYCWPNQYININSSFSCSMNCSDGYFMKNGQCIMCSDSCLTCNLTESKCTKCKAGRILFNRQCLDSCPGGFILVNSTCVYEIPDLVAFQSFNSDSAYQSLNDQNCINYGATPSFDRYGNQNNSLSFDGNSTFVQCPIKPLILANDWTLAGWIQHRNTTEVAGIISNNVGVYDAPIISIQGNLIGFEDVGYGNANIFADEGPEHQFKWIFAVITKEADMIRVATILFDENTNNSKFDSDSISYIMDYSPSILIGYYQKLEPGLKTFNGIIDDLQIFNRSLTNEEKGKLFCFPYSQNNNTCSNICSEGFFMHINKTCQKCNSQCKACRHNSEKCTKCEDNLFLHLDRCLSECPTSFISNGSICVPEIGGLVSFYPFTNNANDWSGSCNDCFNIGAKLASDRFGISNSAYDFDGMQSLILCPIQLSAFQNNWTITAWIQQRSPVIFAGIVSNNVGVKEAPILTITNKDTLIGMSRCAVNWDGVQTNITNDYRNQWIFAVLMKDGPLLKIWANQFLDEKNITFIETPLIWNLKFSSWIQIGRHQLQEQFDGKIDDIRIQNRSLQDNEVMKLFREVNCPENQFYNGSLCSACNISCQKCNVSANNCTICLDKTLILHNGKCLSVCPEGFQNNGTQCTSKILGLAAYYPFSNDTTDWSGNNNHCKNIGATFTSNRFGIPNSSAFFDGYLSYLLCEIPSSTFLNDWTISAWINHKNLSPWAGIVSNNVGVHEAPVLHMEYMTNKIETNRVGTNGVPNPIQIDLGTNHFNKWIFVVILKESQNLKLISIVGDEISYNKEEILSWNFSQSSQIYIGRTDSDQMEIWNGSIDDVRIQNRALDISEIYSLFCFPDKFYYKNNSSCLDSCPDVGYYLKDNECKQCNMQCKTCLSEINCISCNVPYALSKRACVSNCPVGQYIDENNVCSNCNQSCFTCLLTNNYCTSCQAPYGLQINSCVLICPAGNFMNETVCSPCNLSLCKTCNNSENSCTSCQANMQLKQSNCVPSCTAKQQQNFDNKSCQFCQTNCEICQNSDQCTKCSNGYAINWLSSLINICEKPICFSNEYRSNGVCFPCPNLCKTCNSDKACFSCIQNAGLTLKTDGSLLCEPCKTNEIQTNNYCVPNCSQGQFLNWSSITCAKCIAPCKECLNETACLKCVDKLQLSDGKQCIEHCPHGQIIDRLNDTLFCSKCQIVNCLQCESIIECKQCVSQYYLYNGHCIYTCPSSNPPNNASVCTTSNQNNQVANSIKEEFSNSLLAIFSQDDGITSLLNENISFSPEASFQIINSFMNLTTDAENTVIDDLWSNQMIGQIIQSAIGTTLKNLTNASIQEIIDNKESMKSLCEATKMSQLSNYSSKCMDIVNNIKNDKMTLAQTQGILSLIIITAKPRIIKSISNNSTNQNYEDIQSTNEKQKVLDILNTASNSLCIRNPANLTNVNQTEENVEIVFNNITSKTTIIQHSSSVVNISFNDSFSNIAGMVYKSFEIDYTWEVVPKNNETFFNKVLSGKLLKQCSKEFSNEDQPLAAISNNIIIEILFWNNDPSVLIKQPSESSFFCAFLSIEKSNDVNNKEATWDNVGLPEIRKENEKLCFLCKNYNNLGFQTILQSSEASMQGKGNSSLVLIITLSIVGALLIGVAIFTICWYMKNKRVSKIIDNKTTKKKLDQNDNNKHKNKDKKEATIKTNKDKKSLKTNKKRRH